MPRLAVRESGKDDPGQPTDDRESAETSDPDGTIRDPTYSPDAGCCCPDIGENEA